MRQDVAGVCEGVRPKEYPRERDQMKGEDDAEKTLRVGTFIEPDCRGQPASKPDR